MKRVALYVRVSTEEQKQHGISVDAQIYQLKEYSKANNYKIVDIYSDAGISARKSYKKRPALLRMIKDAQAGKIDLILITKLDRFFRSVEDYYTVISQLNNVPWQAIQEDYETVTSSGVFKVNIMLSVAQSEADRTSERIKAALDYKKAKGEYNAGKCLPVGYILKDKKLYINPAEEKGLRAFFDAYINYHSVYKAIDIAAGYGLSINTDQAYRILRSPIHLEKLPYVMERYLTDEQVELIKRQKRQTIKHKSNEYSYLFSGLIKCKKCGALCVSQKQTYNRKDGEKTYTITYICSNHRRRMGCAGSSINEKRLEPLLLTTLDNIIGDYNLSLSTAAGDKAKNDIQKLNARLKRLRDLYEIGDISFTEYKSKKLSIQEEIEINQSKVDKTPKELPSNWIQIYSELDTAHKRAFWSRTINYIEVDALNCKTPKIII